MPTPRKARTAGAALRGRCDSTTAGSPLRAVMAAASSFNVPSHPRRLPRPGAETATPPLHKEGASAAARGPHPVQLCSVHHCLTKVLPGACGFSACYPQAGKLLAQSPRDQETRKLGPEPTRPLPRAWKRAAISVSQPGDSPQSQHEGCQCQNPGTPKTPAASFKPKPEKNK